jgi:Uma2 family endonuclease
MNDRSVIAPQPIPAHDTIPPLVEGDQLTRDEFERRYDAMPNLKKAELIEGVVHMASAVRFERHGWRSRHLSGWFAVYEAATPGVLGADNTTVRLDSDNDPQPDGLLLIDPALGGQARISVDDYLEMAPELVGEISSSTVRTDLGTKFRVYQRNQVREYLVWRVLDKAVDWFVLRQGKYDRLQPGADGILKSEVFPGLWLDAEALVRGDLAGVLAVVQQGIASPEHGHFAAELQKAKKP